MTAIGGDSASRNAARAATAVAVVHLIVSAFIVFGGLLVVAGVVPLWLHVPFAVWGVLVHGGNLTCPLTPLERRLRGRAGLEFSERGFVEHHLMPRRWRGREGRGAHVAIAAGILVVNALVYGAAFLLR
jgi:hypothetical protein